MAAMNDPHVKAIHYIIEHDGSIDWRDAKPLAHEDELFRIKVDKVQVTVEPKNHYATADEAKGAVEGFMRRWEFEAALSGRSGSFKLRYGYADIIDRSPTPHPPGVNANPVTFRSEGSRMQVRLTRAAANYPAPYSGRPPIEPDNPDAMSMLYRFDLYRQRMEPLGSMAYFCLTVLESSVPWGVGGKGRRQAAAHYRINRRVLDTVGKLLSETGGPAARKAEGRSRELTEDQTYFLEASIAAFIRRVAERAADPRGELPKITIGSLSKLQ